MLRHILGPKASPTAAPTTHRAGRPVVRGAAPAGGVEEAPLSEAQRAALEVDRSAAPAPAAPARRFQGWRVP